MFLRCMIQTADTGTLADSSVSNLSLVIAYLMCPKNWRAVLAMAVTVVPTFPGLISSINPTITVGYASHLFDIAWIYGVSFETRLVFCVRTPRVLMSP